MIAMVQGSGSFMDTLDMLRQGGSPTGQVVVVVLTVFSLVSWVVIVWKWKVFRTLRREGFRFVQALERSQRLEDAYRTAVRLPETPYTRLMRQGTTFFSELRPGALGENATPQPGLSETQLHALWLVLEKVQDEEVDSASSGLIWLAIVAVISPLLGLLGTVTGIMVSFNRVAAMGSASIANVAPGIAEALVTTAFGLIAAIPAGIAYNYFVHRVDRFSGELNGFASEFIGTLAREGKL